jgi:hypothetical protein
VPPVAGTVSVVAQMPGFVLIRVELLMIGVHALVVPGIAVIGRGGTADSLRLVVAPDHGLRGHPSVGQFGS